MLSKSDIFTFVSATLSVIIGVFITFAIQDWLNKRAVEKDVAAGLNLVVEELQTCKEDIVGCAEKMDREAAAAEYFLRHMNDLSSCPQDSLNLYGFTLVNNSVLTLTTEAVDLIKSSDVFQAINDNELSLSILRAYDVCEALQTIFNDHESLMGGLMGKACKTENITEIGGGTKMLDFKQMMQDKQVREVIVQVCMSNSRTLTQGLPYIDETLSKIEEYLKGR